MKPLATGGLIIALCGAPLLCRSLFAPSATARQNPAPRAINLIYLNGLIYPNGLALDDKGDLYISDIGAHRVLKLDRPGRLAVIAGTGEGGFGGDGGPATKARLFAPHDLAFDSAGDLLIADTFNHRIRRVDRRGTITTVAGDGKAAYSGDGGPATQASLNTPQGIAFDREGALLIADTFNHVVRRVERDGKITTFTGTVPGHGGEGGGAKNAQINLAMAVAASPDGAVYISDAANSRIRRVTPDGGTPLEAKLNTPQNVAAAKDGSLFIADRANPRIRKVDTRGPIITIAGA